MVGWVDLGAVLELIRNEIKDVVGMLANHEQQVSCQECENDDPKGKPSFDQMDAKFFGFIIEWLSRFFFKRDNFAANWLVHRGREPEDWEDEESEEYSEVAEKPCKVPSLSAFNRVFFPNDAGVGCSLGEQEEQKCDEPEDEGCVEGQEQVDEGGAEEDQVEHAN